MCTPRKTKSRVTAAWEAQFNITPTAVLMRTALDDEGIAANAGAYQLPPDLGASGRLDQAVLNLADNFVGPSKALSVFEGRKGAVAISACAKLFG